jgi:hypothetical protein
MADVRITISLIPGSTSLYLTDSNGNKGKAAEFTTTATRGNLVIWQLAADSGISAIKGVRAKNGYFSLFRNKDPKAEPDGSWCGKIKDDADGVNSYDILYLIGDDSYTEDPDIKVDPPKP